MFDLTGKCALVTGATGGIGGEIAKALHCAGAAVGLSGTRTKRLDVLASELGERVCVLPADLSAADGPDTLARSAEKALSAVDILVNNAGLIRDNLAMRMTEEEWGQVLLVNLTAAFRLSRAVLRGMMRRRWGRIIGITSIVGVTGGPGQVNYAASKAGMIGMSKSLAREVASRGITVNCVAPGFIETAMIDALGDQRKQTLLSTIPTGRMGTPGEIAAATLYLASQEAAYVTGQTLHVNGGMAMI